jgi:SAM-dependent methyltransferase
MSRLVDEEEPAEGDDDAPNEAIAEETSETPLSLNEQRLMSVLAALRACGAKRVLDLGCGEGKLMRELVKDRQFERVVGMDVSVVSLQRAVRRLGYDRLPPLQKSRVELIHGSLMYLDPPRLKAFERVLFEFARPRTVALTTPNREYNVTWETLPAGQFRHADHRFEWTREEFRDWATGVAARYGYAVRFVPVGPEHPAYGSPTQMAVFQKTDAGEG